MRKLNKWNVFKIHRRNNIDIKNNLILHKKKYNIAKRIMAFEKYQVASAA